MKYKALSVAVLAVMIYSCASKSKTVPTAEAKKVELTPELAEGKMLYENNCNKCHKLYESTKFTAEKWQPIVMKMQKKAHLDDFQGQKIYNYLTAIQ